MAAMRGVCFPSNKSLSRIHWIVFTYFALGGNELILLTLHYIAFRDREAGRQNNRSKDTEENRAEGRGGHSWRGGREGRGGRAGGGGGGRREFDRHSATGITYGLTPSTRKFPYPCKRETDFSLRLATPIRK